VRKLFGLAVLILGLLALWLWARSDHARKMEVQISQAAKTVAANSIHAVKSSVSGRDIRATGLADSDAEHKSIIAALDEVEGRRVVVDELKVLETASPFIFMEKKGADGVSFSGNLPNEASRAGFAKLIGDAAAAKLKARRRDAGGRLEWLCRQRYCCFD
jgi:OOP family OmpA-OmpF porin